jgi:hypothetical protein
VLRTRPSRTLGQEKTGRAEPTRTRSRCRRTRPTASRPAAAKILLTVDGADLPAQAHPECRATGTTDVARRRRALALALRRRGNWGARCGAPVGSSGPANHRRRESATPAEPSRELAELLLRARLGQLATAPVDRPLALRAPQERFDFLQRGNHEPALPRCYWRLTRVGAESCRPRSHTWYGEARVRRSAVTRAAIAQGAASIGPALKPRV